MSFEARGVDQLVRRLSDASRSAEGEVRATSKVIGADLAGRSARLAPIEYGDLRGSAYWDVQGSGTVSVEVGFEGLPYILVQHENTEYNHPRGGQSKFLESPWNERKDQYAQMVADAATGALTGRR